MNAKLMTTVIAGTFSTGLIMSPQAFASNKAMDKDPYTAGFEAYAKENPTLSGAIEAYKKDIEKAVKAKPDLVETPEELGHTNNG